MSKSNSSTSSSNKCRRCKNSVQTGLKCVVCGVVSHKSCLNAIKGVKFIDESSVNCCCNEPTDEQPTVNSSTIQNQNHAVVNTCLQSTDVAELKIGYLEELLKQKDLIILNQSIAINSLQQQLSYLKRERNLHDATTHPTQAAPIPSASYADVSKKPASLSNNNTPNSSSKFSSATVSRAIHSAQAQTLCREVIHLTDDVQSEPQNIDSRQNFHQNSRPNSNRGNSVRNRNRNILVGDVTTLPPNINLRSAKNTAVRHFHTTNWDPDTDEDVLIAYLRDVVKEVQVEKLISRNPSKYASFKVTVPKDEASKVTGKGVWPGGILVNQFFRPRTSTCPESSPSE